VASSERRAPPAGLLAAGALEWRYTRSSGPGGQNVNKVSSAVELRCDVARLGLTPEVRARLLALAGQRATRDGAIVIFAQRHRSQLMNRADALARLRELLQRASLAPARRIATRAPRAALEARLDAKQRRARTKLGRAPVRGQDE
jgi:ribosome-associated protein